MYTYGPINGQQRKFPDYFKFGSASASYQVEGAWNVDGKGPNIWDEYTHNFPERIADGNNGDVACNSYEKYKEDVQLLKQAGMNFYRFSISWSRIMPNGDTSNLNEPGLLYYDNLINELLANGIEPVITIYHWDLPQALQNLGGFVNPLIADYFVDYADVLFERYGDRVKTWITFNEPVLICEAGYGNSGNAPLVWAPGVGNYLCAHNLLISHARIYHLYQDKYKSRYGAKVGITINCSFTWPSNPNVPADVIAAERGMQFYCGWWTHPIYSKTGNYPQIMIDVIDRNSEAEGRPWSRLPKMSPELQEYIKGTGDFIGLNYYSSDYGYGYTPGPDPSFWNDRAVGTYQDDNWPTATADWLRYVPEGLRAILNWFTEQYDHPEIIITENGWSDYGDLNDQGRIYYLKGHLNAVLDAIEDGVNVTAHTTWSLLDNFEWLSGYTDRLGIYYVDHTDPERRRTAKASVAVLREIIETRVVPE